MKLFGSLFNKKQERKKFNLDWMLNLPAQDDINALQVVNQHLELIANDQALSAEQRMLALSQIDDCSHRYIAKVTAHYARFDHLRPELESKFWEAAYYYYRSLFSAYYGLITTQAEQIFSLENVTRETQIWSAIHAGAMMNKWRYFRQHPAPDKTWLQISQLYLLAEQAALLDIPVKLYQEEPGSTIGELFIQACMLDSLLEIDLHKNYLEAADQLLKVWLKNVYIHEDFSAEKFIYYVDLDQDKGGRRIRELEPKPSFRFWRTAQISEKISNILRSIENKESLYKYGLGEVADYPYLQDLLVQLDTTWSATKYRRQRRNESRQTTSKPVSAVYGMENVCKLLRQTTGSSLAQSSTVPMHERSFEERLASRHVGGKHAPVSHFFEKGNEQWMIVNESRQGYGALIGKNTKENVKIDNLAGLLPQGSRGGVIIGIIKNIKPLYNNQQRIGIHVLSKKASWVEIAHVEMNPENQLLDGRYENNGNVISSRYLDFSAIYLSPETGLSDTPSLILPRLEFQPNGYYQIFVRGEKLTMQLSQLMDAKDDWVRVRYPLDPIG